MILRLFRRTPRDDTIAALYGMIVAQARAPAFYRTYGVPDTVNGRLEMVMLHAVLLLRRLERWTEAAAAYDRALELTANRAERSFLEARLAEVRGRAGRTGPTGPTG